MFLTILLVAFGKIGITMINISRVFEFFNNLSFHCKIVSSSSQFQTLSNITIGILTGLISSLLVTRYYRKRDEFKEAQIYYRELTKTVEELAYQLTALHLEVSQSSAISVDFDQRYETIRRIYRSRPFFDRSKNILPAVRKYYPEFNRLCERLKVHLNSYYRAMTVLSVYEREHLDLPPAELEVRITNEQNKRRAAALQIGVLDSFFHLLKSTIQDDINQRQSD